VEDEEQVSVEAAVVMSRRWMWYLIDRQDLSVDAA
jgi:hypothetical protein